MILRDYQEKAVESVYQHLKTKRNSNPCLVIPTGGGKTPILARICRDVISKWNGRVIIVSHVKELLEQSIDHLLRDDPTLPIGIYSAGLGSKVTDKPITVAGIQSIYKVAREIPIPNLVIIDEAHRIPIEGEGMYRTFLSNLLARSDNLRILGLTATPYRTGVGEICTPENILNEVCIEVGVLELIKAGYLCRLISKGGSEETDFSGVKVARGEFVQTDLEKLMQEDVKVAMAIGDILEQAKGRKSILIFATGISHGNKLARMIREAAHEEVGEVYGDTNSDERKRTIERFRAGSLRFLVNVQVLTTGFDAPNIDCVALLRATLSPGLYSQMCGRGFRIDQGKENCLLLDFGGNVVRHGRIDEVRPDTSDPDADKPKAKKCPDCMAFVSPSAKECSCGFVFPEPVPMPKDPTHGSDPYNGSIYSDETLEVNSVSYAVHEKLGAEPGHPRTLKVNYNIGFEVFVSEWICLEHKGYPRQKAERWWGRRGKMPVPLNVEDARDRSDELKCPQGLSINFHSKYPEIKGYVW